MENKNELTDAQLELVSGGIAWGGPTMLHCRKAGKDQQEFMVGDPHNEDSSLVASARDANLFS